jgi:hypothetical protein
LKRILVLNAPTRGAARFACELGKFRAGRGANNVCLPYRKGEDVENGWIKCSDRLPELTKVEDYGFDDECWDVSAPVLVIDEYHGFVVAEYDHCRASGNRGWGSVEGQQLERVTYWLPIPEPPDA